MDAPSPRLDLDEVRAAVRLRIAATSLRRTAREVGLSATGLTGFLVGRRTYIPTLQKLAVWYAGRMRNSDDRLTYGHAATILAMLVDHLPEPQKSTAEGGVLTLLQQLTREAGVPLPRWMREMDEDGEEAGDDEGESR